MIVYGDPSYQVTLGELRDWLRARVAALQIAGAATQDDLRPLLIQAGELEQAAEDALPDDDARPLRACLAALTERAARIFLAGLEAPVSLEALDDLARAAERIGDTAAPFLTCRLTVKVPEGFAFYALYPEQYVLAARRFLADHAAVPPNERTAAVVGVRSIGTTLSAVVGATLESNGWRARRLTVRPTGHPWARVADVDPAQIAGAAWGLIVDEGPGASGSSFAAVADALARAGLPPERIVFLPAHAGAPGDAATDAVRAWWARAARYVASRDELRWEGRALPDALAARTAELCGEDVVRVEDLGGGLWRRVVYSDEADWPAANVSFERPKFRVTLRSGARVLWKYAGLASDAGDPARSQAEAAFSRLARRSEDGDAPAPQGTRLGFVARPWIDGTPLTRTDATPDVLARIGYHIAHAAGPPLAPVERDAARARLNELLYWNVWEALGEDAAARARRLTRVADGPEDAARAASYGDGRLASHEWLRTSDGRIVKTDTGEESHDADHTVVGRQPLAWDVAGALVEWGLDGENAAEPLLNAVQEAGIILPAPDTLRFYRLAYAAFRVGQTTLCAQMIGHDPHDQARLWRAADDYRGQLTRLLSDEPT